MMVVRWSPVTMGVKASTGIKVDTNGVSVDMAYVVPRGIIVMFMAAPRHPVGHSVMAIMALRIYAIGLLKARRISTNLLAVLKPIPLHQRGQQPSTPIDME